MEPNPEKMTGDEFRQHREDMGLSVRDLAYVLGTREDTIRKWEKDAIGPNPVAARALQWLVEDGYVPPELDEVRKSHVAQDAASHGITSKA